MAVIACEGVSYDYAEGARALNGVDLAIEAGEFVAVIGHNGSGKSTLAKHLNALFLPTEGKVTVLGMDSSVEENILPIRQNAGMVFQNPDNQMVTTIVEEDVAFGPENLGVPSEEIRARVDKALAVVGMTEFATFAPHHLSGGQKQRIAIAGVLAMQPQILILDEATAMLDPAGREEILETAIRLNREDGMTLILITHFMEEAARADRIVVVSHGQIAMQGTPAEVFSRGQALDDNGIDAPFPIRLAEKLREGGLDVPDRIDLDALADAICASVMD